MVMIYATAFLSLSAYADDPVDSTIEIFPMNVMEDSGSFSLYVNESPIITGQFEWHKNGAFSGDYKLEMAGQEVSTSMQIAVDESGRWNKISMQTVQGDISAVIENDSIKVDAKGSVQTIALKDGTVIFENYSPALMSQAVFAYDQEVGGKQTFPLFIIPAVIMDASLERLETVQRQVMGKLQDFVLYRYGLPGVDVTLWVDGNNRFCMGDVPAQHAAYVRDGYEVLMVKEEVDSLLSQPKYEVKVESNVEVPMRDGIKLATDIYFPDAEGPFPVILVRTPYKKELNELQAEYFARRGYVYAVQDCRGRFSSPGEWRPLFDEPNDGYDAVEWLAAQSWSNGKVGMIGASYLGWVQWWAASQQPPHLATIIPNVSPPDPYYNIPYEYGSFFTLGAIWWADILESEATDDLTGSKMGDINKKEYAKLLKHLPVIELDSIVLGKVNKYWREWIAHPDLDEYWEPVSFSNKLEGFDIPVYHQSGWYDGDGIGSKLNYLAMKKHGHGNQKLILGPWGHTDEATRRGPNNSDFGGKAIVNLQRSYLRWLDRWLLGVDNGIDKEPLVSLFVMGSNDWLHGDVYPLPETEFTNFYLASKGAANSSLGDGWLSAEPPVDSCVEYDSYVYDPADPTPDPNMYVDPEEEECDSTKAQAIEDAIARVRAYYAEVDKSRKDILVYDMPPMAEPLTFAGPIEAVLYAASSAKDTDWFMKLSKIDTSGQIFPMTHGVIRARYRNSMSKPEMLKPGKIYEYHIDMWQSGMTVMPGERLRVEVASASFPMFSRNLNTGGHNETETEFISAEQKIYHDTEHPSHIILPVIKSPQFGE